MIQRRIELSATPTITASSAYTSGNALGGLLTFSGIGMTDQMTLAKVMIFDKANQKAATDLLLFNQTFTATADKSAIAISNTDLLNMVGHVNLVAGDYATVGTGAIATHTFNSGLPILLGADPNMKLYGQLVTRGTPTYASTSDIIVKLNFEVWHE
jgi:hypothetical protein